MDKAVKNELVSPSRLLKIFQEASAQRKIVSFYDFKQQYFSNEVDFSVKVGMSIKFSFSLPLGLILIEITVFPGLCG